MRRGDGAGRAAAASRPLVQRADRGGGAARAQRLRAACFPLATVLGLPS